MVHLSNQISLEAGHVIITDDKGFKLQSWGDW
jgi:hypothetical protein